MSERQELDDRISAALRKWFELDFDTYHIPREARNTLVLSVNLAFHEGISQGIDLGAAACMAGIARGTRETVQDVRDRMGERQCDETRRDEQC